MAEGPESSQSGQASVVDLFAGPGGLDVAATWLGLHLDGLEWDKDACETRTAAGLPTYEGDVRDRGPKDYPGATILTGGPPCQTYTVAGSGSGRKALDKVKVFAERMADNDPSVERDLRDSDDDPNDRTALVLEPLRWALEAHRDGTPFRKIVLEQVPAVRHVWAKYAEILRPLGYDIKYGVVHTEEYGVPQTRRRAILLASIDAAIEFPPVTHQRYLIGIPRAKVIDEDGIRPWVTMGDALPERGKFEVISNYGSSGNPKLRGRRTSDQPSATITGKVRRNRLVANGSDELDRLWYMEAGRLQTFPMDFPWRGRDQAQQIGNAIPPRLAVHALAAVLGLNVKDNDMDAAVDGEWEKTKESQPLANSSPKRPTEPMEPALFDA